MAEKPISKFSIRHRNPFTVFLCLVLLYASANAALQPPPDSKSLPTGQQSATPAPTYSASNKKLIFMKKAGVLLRREGFESEVLIDSVELHHDGAVMYCDSAYLNKQTNSFEAFGRVFVNQGDTLFLYGKRMYYDGNSKLLEIRKDVRLENNKDMVLYTDSLNYDRVANLAYYFDGGMLVDKENELTSFWGQYQPALKLATFRDSVQLVNDRFTLHSQVLKYNTDSKIATIVGESTIVSDSGTIYTSNGWYNTVTDESLLLDKSIIVNKEGNRTLTGDSIFYNKEKGYGEVFGNMILQDTLKKVILKGHYGFYNEKTDYAMATDSAYCIEYSKNDSLYLHADSLFLRTDTLIKDSREIQAYNNVRFFRSDIQGVCDSMIYRTKDSVLYLYKEPILWNEQQQISGDTIEIYMNDSTIELAYIKKSAFAIQDIDSLHHNQLKGREMRIKFENNALREVYVEGNAESIFYPEEKDKTLAGRNQTESSYLILRFKDKAFEWGKIWPRSVGKMLPLADLTAENKYLKGFQWFGEIRPLNKDDIFRTMKKKDVLLNEPRQKSARFSNVKD